MLRRSIIDRCGCNTNSAGSASTNAFYASRRECVCRLCGLYSWDIICLCFNSSGSIRIHRINVCRIPYYCNSNIYARICPGLGLFRENCEPFSQQVLPANNGCSGGSNGRILKQGMALARSVRICYEPKRRTGSCI